jgi:hypothetical protein
VTTGVTSGVGLIELLDHIGSLYRHNMDVKQTMARLPTEIRTNREEMRAGQKHLKEEMRTG